MASFPSFGLSREISVTITVKRFSLKNVIWRGRKSSTGCHPSSFSTLIEGCLPYFFSRLSWCCQRKTLTAINELMTPIHWLIRVCSSHLRKITIHSSSKSISLSLSGFCVVVGASYRRRAGLSMFCLCMDSLTKSDAGRISPARLAGGWRGFLLTLPAPSI